MNKLLHRMLLASHIALAVFLFTVSLSAGNLKKIKVMIPIGDNSYAIGRGDGVFLMSPDGSRIIMRDSSTGRHLQINDKVYDSGQTTYWSNTLAYSEDGAGYAMLCARRNWGFFREAAWRIRQSFRELGGGNCSRAACSCLLGAPRMNLYRYYHSGDAHDDTPLREDTDFSLLYNDRIISALTAQTYDVFPFSIRLSADGKTCAYQYSKGKKQFAACNKNLYGPYEKIEELNLSRDGKQLYVHYFKNQREYFRINDMEFGPIDWMYHDGTGESFYVKKGAYKYAFIRNNVYGPFADIHAFISDDTADNTAFCFTACKDTPGSYRYNDETLSNSCCYIQLNDVIRAKLPDDKRNSISIFFSKGNYSNKNQTGYYSDGQFIRYQGPYVSLFHEALTTIDGRKVALYQTIDQYSVAVHYNNRRIGIIRGNMELVYPSADGEKLFILYENDFKQYLQVNQKKYGPIPQGYRHWFISPGGSYYGYITDDRYVYLNEDKLGPFPYGAGMPLFTSDDKKVIIKYSIGHDAHVRINDSVHGPYAVRHFQVGVTSENRIVAAYLKDGYAYIDELQ